MSKCLLTYQNLSSGDYDAKALKKISRNLKNLSPLPYTTDEQRIESAKNSTKMSIQGIQVKFSATLSINRGLFQIVGQKGTYIFKPQSSDYNELPENEDLSMHLAEMVDIKVPLHGLIKGSDNRLSYFIKRFDRYGRDKKRAVEDFSQLQLKSRDTKYDSNVEKLIKTIKQYTTFPKLELIEFYKRFLFNWIIGNEDMHLKNYSLLKIDDIYKLAPAYDFLNTTIALHNPKEESALPLNGKKNNLSQNDLKKYLPKNLLELSNRDTEETLSRLINSRDSWINQIERSFLSEQKKDAYKELLTQRISKISKA